MYLFASSSPESPPIWPGVHVGCTGRLAGVACGFVVISGVGGGWVVVVVRGCCTRTSPESRREQIN